MALIGFVLGFVVPTWYRAHKSPYGVGDRRMDPQKRERFTQELQTIRRSNIRSSSKSHPAT
jgi:hypothetical protein